MKRGQKLRDKQNRAISLFPAPRLLVTQEMFDTYSHSNWRAMDFSGKDFTSYDLFAPFPCEIIDIIVDPVHKVVYGATEDVVTPKGIKRPIFALAHDPDISALRVGQKFEQGDVIYQYGGYGYGDPKKYSNHIHLEAGFGPATKPYYIPNEFGRKALRGEACPADIFFVNDTVVTKPGVNIWSTWVEQPDPIPEPEPIPEPTPEPEPVPVPEPTPTPPPAPIPPQPTPTFRVEDRVKVVGVRYATGQTIPAWVKKAVHQVAQIKNDRALLVNKVSKGKIVDKGIYSWVYLKDLVKAS